MSLLRSILQSRTSVPSRSALNSGVANLLGKVSPFVRPSPSPFAAQPKLYSTPVCLYSTSTNQHLYGRLYHTSPSFDVRNQTVVVDQQGLGQIYQIRRFATNAAGASDGNESGEYDDKVDSVTWSSCKYNLSIPIGRRLELNNHL